MRGAEPGGGVRYRQPAGRWVLLATALGSGLAFLDATVVNVALPQIGGDFRVGAAGLQWTINGYMLSLAGLILLGGSLGDLFGRRRIFVAGVIWFAVASLLCGIAPNIESLIAARIAQGAGAAALTPGALAILEASFHRDDRAKAIGAWSGLAGLAGALGPLVGGWLVQVATWRLVFLLNVPLAALTVLVALRHVPESRNLEASRRVDIAGLVTGVVGLAGLSYGFIAWPTLGLTSPVVLAAVLAGLASAAAFVVAERRSPHPMIPLGMFTSKTFTSANLVTFAVYAALAGVFFLVVVNLQVVGGYSPLVAGMALFPITALMLLLSARAGALAQRIGPKIPMTIGPAVCAVALLMLSGAGARASFAGQVLPAVVLLGLGLSLAVPALTTTALTSAGPANAGIASGVNNAVARTAGLLAVAVLPLAAGLGTGSLTNPAALAAIYPGAMLLCAGLMLAGAAIALAGIPVRFAGQEAEAPPTAPRVHCGAVGPPLYPGGRGALPAPRSGTAPSLTRCVPEGQPQAAGDGGQSASGRPPTRPADSSPGRPPGGGEAPRTPSRPRPGSL